MSSQGRNVDGSGQKGVEIMQCIPSSPRIQLGYQDSELSAEASWHESHPLFKVAFRNLLAAELGPTAVHDLASNLDIAELNVDPTSGWVETADASEFASAGISANTQANVTLGTEPEQGCEDTPKGWRKTRSFSLSNGSGKWSLGMMLDEYEQLLIADDPKAKVTDAARAELAGITILARLSWENTYIVDH